LHLPRAGKKPWTVHGLARKIKRNRPEKVKQRKEKKSREYLIIGKSVVHKESPKLRTAANAFRGRKKKGFSRIPEGYRFGGAQL